MGWRHSALGAFNKVGGYRLVQRLFGRDRLTVLAYHRVVDHTSGAFVGFVRNVSASPESFDQQMRFVTQQYNPVSIDDLIAALDGQPLPERSLLVTFDDGYRDNYDEALPILSEYSIPVIVFLATDSIGGRVPFWWDLVAWAFEMAGPGRADLPLLGSTVWNEPHVAAAAWVTAAKKVGDSAKKSAVAGLTDLLGTPAIGSTFAESFLDWNLVRNMQTRGAAFGAHTCSHPILSRLDPAEARREVLKSVERIAAETGRSAPGFAYPNGLPGDFGAAAVAAVAEAEIRLAFTLSPGPARKREYVADPLRIRRIYVHHADDMARFRAKCAGTRRLMR